MAFSVDKCDGERNPNGVGLLKYINKYDMRGEKKKKTVNLRKNEKVIETETNNEGRQCFYKEDTGKPRPERVNLDTM